MGESFQVQSKARAASLTALRRASAALLATTALTSASGAYAQATGVVTSNLTEGGSSASNVVDLNGKNGPGITILSGSVTIQNANIHNFREIGGSGSGGGLGAGGVAFVGQGASLTLNNVTVEGNAAIGGLGNTGNSTGGSLNNLGAALNTGGTALPGQPGITWVNTIFGFSDPGNGADGTDGVIGYSGNGTGQVGGSGGLGGFGTEGWAFNPDLEDKLEQDTQTLEEDSALLAKATEAAEADTATATDEIAVEATAVEQEADDVASDVAAGVSEADFVAAGVATALEVQDDLASIDDGEKIAEDATLEVDDAENAAGDDAEVTALEEKVDADETQVDLDNSNLDDWNVKLDTGQVGTGGNGGAGGPSGESDFGLGGQMGGDGGAGGPGGLLGLSGGIPLELGPKGGNGGDGGQGGYGGFGGGGGQGGDGGLAGIGIEPSRTGGAGPGGLGGFGAGNGATGTGYNESYLLGGGGGDGLGGAIFVMTGGTLTITGNATFGNNSAIAGAAAGIQGADGGFGGSDLFMMTGSTVNLDPCNGMINACGNTITFNGVIGDDSAADIGPFGTADGGQVGTGAGLNIYSGIVALNGGNLYSGATVLFGGVLQASDGTGLPVYSNLIFEGSGNQNQAVFETTTGSFTRSLGSDGGFVQWIGSGGFSAITTDLTVNISYGEQLTWDQQFFVSGSNSLLFGTLEATNAVHFINPIQLVGSDDVTVTGTNVSGSTDFAYLDGVLSGSGGLTVDGVNGGQLVLSAVNTYTGATTIDSGADLVLAIDPGDAGSVIGSIANSSNVIDNGTFDISQSTGESIVTLSGSGVLDLGAQTLSLTNASTTFSGAIGGTGGVTITGGTETLTGTNTYTGATTIGSGATIALTGTGSLATSSDIIDNGTFDISGTSGGADIVTLSGSGVVNLGSQLLTITDGSTTFSGVIQDPPGGDLEISGGTQTLSGVNTYSGYTQIDSGATLALTGAGSISDSNDVIANGTFDISGTNAGALITTLDGSGVVNLGAKTLTLTNAFGEFFGVIQGSGGLTIDTGLEDLYGTNTYTGVTLLDPTANLFLVGNGSIADSQDVVNNGYFDISYTNSGASIVTLSGSGDTYLGAETLTLSNASTTYSGDIFDLGAGGGVTIAAGTETLTGENDYSGVTLIDSGAELVLAGDGSIEQSQNVTDNGVFDISATNNGAWIITLSGSGVVNLGAQDLTLTDASTTFSGGINGTGFVEIAAGTETLTGTNTYTGFTYVDPGASLLLTGTGSIAKSQDVEDDGVFDISGTSAGASIVTLSGDGLVTLGAETLTLSNASTEFDGVIQGSGGLTVAAGSGETLTGTNTYTGVTLIDSGTELLLTGTGSIADSSNVTDNGTFDISGTSAGASIITLSGSGVVNLGGEPLVLSNASTTFSGGINGSGGLEVAAGAETFTGTNTYTGVTLIDSGASLLLTGTGSIADSSDVADNGTFDISGTSAGASIITLSGSGVVNLGAETLTLTDASSIFSGVIGGTGGVTLAAGAEELTGTNTYTGTTLIDPGSTLYLADTGSIADSANVTDNGTFDISLTTAGASIVTLSGSGVVNLGGEPLVLSNASTTFSGGINGSGSLEVAAGAETFTGTNTYTGVTQIDPGAKLLLTGTGSIAESQNVDDNGTFDISGTSAGASIVTLSGDGVVKLGAETLTLTAASTTFAGGVNGTGGLTVAGGEQGLSGANTYTGTTLIDAGQVLALIGSGSIANSQNVTANGFLDISNTTAGASIVTLSGSGYVNLGAETLTLTNASTTFSGAIYNTGGLTVAAGSETLSGENDFTGTTLIDSGAKLLLTGNGTISSSANVADNGTLDISGAAGSVDIQTLSGSGKVTLGNEYLWVNNGSTTFSGVISGNGGLVVSGGTETLSGVNTYTGLTAVLGGARLNLVGAGSIADSVDPLVNGTFDISGAPGGTSVTSLSGTGAVILGSQTLTLTNAFETFDGVISGAGGLSVTGGTEALSGTNTYTGQTSISPGATLALVGTGSILGTSGVVDNGTLDISGTTDGATITTLSGSGVLDTGTESLTILDGSSKFTGQISGDGPLNVMAGQQTLDGPSSFGPVGVSGGSDLVVGDINNPGASLTSPAVTLTGGGTLSGFGFINGPVTNTSGVVSPGGTPNAPAVGVLTVNSYTQGPAGTLAIDVTPSAASELNVLGAASLNGKLDINYQPGAYAAHVYSILGAASITGGFSSVVQTGTPTAFVTALYNLADPHIQLVIEPVSAAQGYGAIETSTLDQAQSIASMVYDRQANAGCSGDMRAGFDASNGTTKTTSTSALDQDHSCDGTSFWGHVLARTDHTSASSVASAATGTNGGFIGGIDHRFAAGETLGLAVAYTSNRMTEGDAALASTGDSTFVSVYGGVVVDGLNLDAQAFYMGSNWSMKRTVAGYGVASSNPNGTTGGASLAVSYRLANTGLQPYARISYASFGRDSTTEYGPQIGPLALATASRTTDSTRAELGVKWSASYVQSNGLVLSPEVRAGLEQDLSANDRALASSLALIPGTNFQSASTKPDQTAGVLSGTLKARVDGKLDFYSTLGGRFSGNQNEATVSIGGNYRF